MSKCEQGNAGAFDALLQAVYCPICGGRLAVADEKRVKLAKNAVRLEAAKKEYDAAVAELEAILAAPGGKKKLICAKHGEMNAYVDKDPLRSPIIRVHVSDGAAVVEVT